MSPEQDEEEEITPLTWRDLKEALATLPEDRLDDPVIYTKEAGGGFAYHAAILDEDHIDPDGEGIAGVSVYRESGMSDEAIAAERVVACKGQLLLLGDP